MPNPVDRSTSSRGGLTLFSKVGEWLAHFRMRMSGGNLSAHFDAIRGNVAEYDVVCSTYAGGGLKTCRILEIGFGARPLRMFYLMAMGYDVRGIDLDRPVLRGSIAEFWRIGRNNGLERVLKSIVRHFAFDRAERKQFGAYLAKLGGTWRIDENRFVVGDASRAEAGAFPPGHFDFIYSEDVFEHIPEEKLAALCERMGQLLSARGVCFIRLSLFTGLAGGHLVEWYPHTLAANMVRRSEPWEHLRQRRFVANTYLNELRLRDYRRIFSRFLDICAEKAMEPTLERQFLTPEIGALLGEYSEEELLSNYVLFILRRKDSR